MRARLWCTLIFGICFATQAIAEGFRVEDIRVEGLQRITAGTVFNYLSVKPGDQVSFERTSEIVRELYQTGFFQDVRLEQRGNVLVVVVTERPAISDINFSGNKSIDTKALTEGLKDIGLAEGRTFERSVLERIEQELERQYFNQGKYGVRITSTVTPLERNRVAIDIDVVEGATALIKRINLVGNTAFPDKRLLGEMQLSTGGWLSRFTRDNQYSRPKLAGDLETLRSFYLDRGYVNFKIASTQVAITPDKQDIYITINIDEGDVYRIGDIRLAGDLVDGAETYFPLVHLRRGEPFSRKTVVESSDRISAKLSDLGFAFANVNSIPEIDEDQKQVVVTFFVDPGKRAYVRRIDIRGNSRTRDQVVRRELRQMEASWFSGEKLKLSRERVQRTGFFDTVNVETPTVPGSSDEVDINLTVTEKPSGTLLAGLGFSQSDGIIVNASINQENFAGTGKKVSLAMQTSSANRFYQVAYTNPYYTVDGISRGFDLSYRATDFDDLSATADYKTDDIVGSVNFGIPLSEFNRFGFSAAFHHIDFEPGPGASEEVLAYEAEEGNRFLNFEVSINWRHDSRNSAVFPRTGALQSLFAESSIPGSDLSYYKISYDHRRYWELGGDLVVSIGGRVAFGDAYGSNSSLPLWERFFGGGPNTVRGFANRSLGPRDSRGRALGGNAMYAGSFELLFPPPVGKVSESVRMAAFVDVGAVVDTRDQDLWDTNEMRYSTGLGLSWLSPIGALTVSYALPFRADNQDEKEQFQFSLGTTF